MRLAAASPNRCPRAAHASPPRALLLVEFPRAPSDITPPLRCSAICRRLFRCHFTQCGDISPKRLAEDGRRQRAAPFAAPSSAKKSASTQTFSVSPSRSQFLRGGGAARRRLGERRVGRRGREEARVERGVRRAAVERAADGARRSSIMVVAEGSEGGKGVAAMACAAAACGSAAVVKDWVTSRQRNAARKVVWQLLGLLGSHSTLVALCARAGQTDYCKLFWPERAGGSSQPRSSTCINYAAPFPYKFAFQRQPPPASLDGGRRGDNRRWPRSASPRARAASPRKKPRSARERNRRSTLTKRDVRREKINRLRLAEGQPQNAVDPEARSGARRSPFGGRPPRPLGWWRRPSPRTSREA